VVVQVHQVKTERKGPKVYQVPQDNLVLMVKLEPLVVKDKEDPMDKRELQARRVHQEQQDQRVKLDSPEIKDQQDRKVQQGLQVLQV